MNAPARFVDRPRRRTQAVRPRPGPPPAARLEELRQLERERPLTEAELQDLYYCHGAEYQRQRRLPARILALEAEARRLRGELWPLFARRLSALEEEQDRARLALIEGELKP